MNIFVGNFSLKTGLQKIPDIDYDIMQVGEKSYFIMGADESISSSSDAIEMLKKNFGELNTYDISIESEDQLEILTSEYEEGKYECVIFEGPEVSFSDILERFADSSDVIAVREAEKSLLYGNRRIKAEFIY